MGVCQVPENVSSITVSGNVLVPASRLVTIADPLDMTTLTGWSTRPFLIWTNQTAGANAGKTDIHMPANISSITINGNVYAVTAQVISAVPAADATLFLQQQLLLVQ